MTLVGEPDPLSDLGEGIVALFGAADIGQDATDALIVALPNYFAWGTTGHTDGDQPPGSAPLLADKLGDTRNRTWVGSLARIGAQFCHSLN